MAVSGSASTADAGPRPRESAAERSRAQTRARLLEAGLALFAERGLHGVTTHDVAARAGVAAGTFYLHFADKRDLLRVIAAETTGWLRERLDRATRSARGSREGVPAFSDALLSFAEEHRDRVRILFGRDGDAAAVQADVLSALAASIAETRRQRAASGEMPADLDPEVLAQALVGMLARVVAWWVEDPRRAPRETVARTLSRIQLSGTHPPAPDAEES
jgi:AcrR family transcriptional regulator